MWFHKEALEEVYTLLSAILVGPIPTECQYHFLYDTTNCWKIKSHKMKIVPQIMSWFNSSRPIQNLKSIFSKKGLLY